MMEDYRSIAGHLQVRIFKCCGDEEASGADWRFGAEALGRFAFSAQKQFLPKYSSLKEEEINPGWRIIVPDWEKVGTEANKSNICVHEKSRLLQKYYKNNGSEWFLGTRRLILNASVPKPAWKIMCGKGNLWDWRAGRDERKSIFCFCAETAKN